MQNLLGRFGSNFIVSSFIPALGFVVTFFYIFGPILPNTFQTTFVLDFSSPNDSLSLSPFILTILIGFTLMGLNTFMYKLLEGYMVLEKIRPWRERGLKKALKRRAEFEIIDKTVAVLKKKQNTANQEEKQRLAAKIKELNQRSYNLKAGYQQDYPAQTRGAMPTSFGNILKASETYPYEHYGIDAVTMWPRLIYAMDPSYYRKVDQSNNGLAFVVNSLVLVLILSVMCLVVSGYQYSRWQYSKSQYAERVELCEAQNKPNCASEISDQIVDLLFFNVKLSTTETREYYRLFWQYLILSPLFLGISIFFYYASLPAARQYGNMIRSSFDLFRFNLLEQLRLHLPPDSDQEHDLWSRWSEFVSLGPFEKDREPFLYHHPNRQKDGAGNGAEDRNGKEEGAVNDEPDEGAVD